ncbi:MAG: tetratricopeptide repeat protein [Deltaproteobacteria bacterium]|nr:tetratricopeptide repeat protein [Deltaproteobacteria bacterium]
MRFASIAFCVVAWFAGAAGAAPRRPPAPKPVPGASKSVPGAAKTGTPAQQAELGKLDQELSGHQSKQAYFAAVKVARKLYDLQRKVSGDDAVETQRRKQMLASMLSVAGDYVEADKLYKELLKTAELAHGVSSREAMYALMPLVGPLWQQSRLDELEPIYLRMLAIAKQLDGEQSQSYASQLTMYATVLNTRNEYSSAQRVYEQALKITEAIAPTKNDMSLIGPIQALAALYWMTNQKPKAIAMYDRAIAITTNDPKSSVLVKASTLWGVSSMYHYGGRDDLAAPLIKRVVELYTNEIARLEKDSPDDFQIPSMLGQLGFQYKQSGDLVNADKTLTRAIAIAAKKQGFSGWESTLAEVKRAQGKPKEALALLEQAQAALTKLSPQSATVYSTLIADVLRELGDFKRAETLLAAYRANIEKTYGKKHPMYGMVLLNTAYLYMGSGNLTLAQQHLTEGLELAEKELTLTLKTGTEADHGVYFARNGYQLDTAINFHYQYAPKSASAAKLGLTTLLRRKGRVLDAAAASLATIRSKLSADDKKLLDELASARAKLAKLTVAGPSATGDADYAKEVAALEDQIQKLELTVGQKSAAYRVVSQAIDLPAVQKVIPKDARLIEIVNFQPGDPKQMGKLNPVLPPRRYAAYVLAAKGDPVLVDLGPAAAIDQAVEHFRKAVSDPDNDRAGDLGHALYELTMSKIIPVLGGATNILIAPDGTLNVVPFSALVDDKQQFLIKRFTFTYLTSGRDLLRLSVKTKAQGGGVIFADPSFDVTGAPPAGGAGGTRGRRSADLASLSWQPLPGTGQEADEVVKTMSGLQVYRGAQATEATLKAVHGPKILHLATHGFFLADEPPPVTPSGDAARSATPAPAVVETYENPLLRSGLAFAGANKLSSGDEDGILTAMEASGLDLWGTKLVVLSACETGVGKVTNGEGVYGLRRSLVIAGAESLVMTLWQVDDLATKDLMAGYYTRLQAGKPRSSALRDVQLEIGARGKYAHPYYWASFLPAGANSPLQ